MIDRFVFTHLIEAKENRGGGFLLLIDPDKTSSNSYLALAEAAEDCGVDAILVGTSFMLSASFGESVKAIKEATSLPVIIFPGSFAQLTPAADAVLFTSLISGRNPEYLIGEQVRGAPLVKRFGLEPIPTAYMLIESGSNTSVHYISGTMPIPREKDDIACAHAMAAQYLGMRLCYLEAGSGATNPVPISMVNKVASCVDIPLLVGGGLRSPEDCAARIDAGASFVVVGNIMEEQQKFDYLRELTAATHSKESVPA
ncbi:MAG: geranylgeranylglyceryl/heptaprenylglyceryl phosphate synthase [Candidatus Zixiibacteriota bacterium]|nr:MAG: geranylgeranylglyceryl/heptaprenylglyceryl phosphate synthase [candidate division Zixibacteria bacterium]